MIIAKRPYPIPSRTRKSSSFASMVLHGRLCGRVDRHRLFFVFVLGWRTYCVSCATHVVGTYVCTPPRTFELASLYLHPAKHKKVFLLRIDTQKYAPFCASFASAALLMWWECTCVRPHAHSSMLPCICIQPSTKKYFCFVLISRNMRHFARLPKIARRATRRVAPPHRQGETTCPNPHQMSLNPEDKHRDHL